MSEENKATNEKPPEPAKAEETQIKVANLSNNKLWFGVKPWIIIVGGVILLILLFAPLFTVTIMVPKTETVLTTVTTEEPIVVTRTDKVKVYVGWLKVKEQGSTTYVPEFFFIPGPIIIGGSGSAPGMAQQQQQVVTGYNPYIPYTGSQTITTTKVDISDEVIDVKYVVGPNSTWDVSLVSRGGTEKIIRNVSEYDLTKTGTIDVEVKENKTKTTTSQVPREVTKEVPTQKRINMVQLILGNY